MGAFFKGWRRKAGLVTLAMALLFLGGWIHSRSESDVLTLPIGSLTLGVLISSDGYLGCTWADYSENQTFPDWNIAKGPIDLTDCGFLFDFSENKRKWRGLPKFNLLSTTIVGLASPVEFELVDQAPFAQTLETSEDGSVINRASAADFDQKADSAGSVVLGVVPDQISAEDLAQLRSANNLRLMHQLQEQRGVESGEDETSSDRIQLLSAVSETIGDETTLAAGSVTIDAARFGLWAIPYWAVVFPLTLVSTYLLFRTPPPDARLDR